MLRAATRSTSSKYPRNGMIHNDCWTASCSSIMKRKRNARSSVNMFNSQGYHSSQVNPRQRGLGSWQWKPFSISVSKHPSISTNIRRHLSNRSSPLISSLLPEKEGGDMGTVKTSVSNEKPLPLSISVATPMDKSFDDKPLPLSITNVAPIDTSLDDKSVNSLLPLSNIKTGQNIKTKKQRRRKGRNKRKQNNQPSRKEVPLLNQLKKSNSLLHGIVNIYKQLDPKYEKHDERELGVIFTMHQHQNQSVGRTWSCQFTCPLTHVTFNCGMVKGLVCNEDGNGLVSYARKIDAELACYALALDSWVEALNNIESFHLSCENNVKTYTAEKLCSDEPLLIPLRDIDDDIGNTISFIGNDPISFDDVGGSLRDAYQSLQQEDNSAPIDAFTFNSTSVDAEGMRWWTSSFTCPLSGKDYHSGTFLTNVKYRIFSSFTSPSTKVFDDGKIYHINKTIAELACQARVLDSIYVSPIAVEKGLVDGDSVVDAEKVNSSNLSTLRYCVEEPLPFRIVKKQEGVDVTSAASSSTTTSLDKDPISMTSLANVYSKLTEKNTPSLRKHLTVTEAPTELGPYAGWWTASFACPLSEMTFHSGDYWKKEKEEKIFGSYNQAESVAIRNKVYYRDKSDAMRACIARVLDAIHFSSYGPKVLGVEGEDESFLPPKYCVEEPRPFQIVTPVIPTINLIPELLIAYGKLNPKFSDSDITAIQKNLLKPNLHSTSAIDIHPKHGSHATYWTSKFTCPITGHTFASSSIQQEKKESLISGQIKDGKRLNNDGNIYYARKVDAERACFASVLDGLNFNFFREEMAQEDPFWRLCVEEPASLSRLPEEMDPKVASHQVNSRDDKVETKEVDAGLLLPPVSGGVGLIQTPSEKNEEVKKVEDFIEVDEDYPQGTNPMDIITKMYRMYNPKDLRASIMSELFVYSSTKITGPGSSLWWTAEFQSPVTNEKFPSGVLRNKSSQEVDGKNYYTKKRFARDASLGLAIDCFVHRNGWVGGEERYQFPENPMAGKESFCLDKAYNTPLGDEHEVLVHPFTPPKQKHSQQDNVMRPKNFINRWYQTLLKEPVSSDVYRSESIEIDVEGTPTTYYTGFFTCPVTNKVFDSGTLLDINSYMPSAHTCSQAPIQVIDDVKYYSKHNVAIQAAAGRACDTLTATNFFASFGKYHHETPVKFCAEDPFSSEIELDGDDDEDDFVIQSVPETKSMEIVLDTWADLETMGAKLDPSQPDALSTALTWLEKLRSETGDKVESFPAPSKDKSLTSLRQTPVTTFSCNAILKALANKVSLGVFPDDTNTESIADEICQHMKVLSKGENALECTPDTETYTHLIRCLQSPSPHDRAKRAEEILESMMSEENQDKVIPAPSFETFNAVMRHWMDVPGEESHKRISALFSKMELSTASNLRPNRETFIIALKSLQKYQTVLDSRGSAHPRFHPKIASKWIERMKKYNTMNGSQNQMTVDTEIFNAALPFITDPVELKSCLERIYDNKFKSKADDTFFLQDAKCIEEWYHHMDQECTNQEKQVAPPDIVTLEALVQAWVKTGSEEGLVKAEFWAFNATTGLASSSNGEMNARLETFYPILLGWAMVNSKNSAEKIESILNRLEEMSETMPHLKPDSRLKSCLLESWRIKQANLVDDVNTTIEVAKEATSYLSSLVEKSESISDLDSTAFETVVGIWGTAAAAAPSEKEKRTCISEMLKVINSHNDLIGAKSLWSGVSLSHMNEANNGMEMWQPPSISPKYRKQSECPSLSDALFVQFMSTLLDITKDDIRLRRDMIRMNFHEVEGHLIRRNVHENKEMDGNKGKHPTLPFPEDLFKNALQWCQFLTHHARNGDSARVAIQILHSVIASHRRNEISQSQAIGIYKEVMDVIQAVVVNSDEHRMITRRIAHDIATSVDIDETLQSFLIEAVPDEIDISDILKQVIDKKASPRAGARKWRMRRRRSRKK